MPSSRDARWNRREPAGCRAGLLLCALLALQTAGARAEVPPLPPPKPPDTEAPASTSEAAPVPPPKPGSSEATSPSEPASNPKEAEFEPPAASPDLPAPGPDLKISTAEACWIRLRHLGAEFEVEPPVSGEGACGIADPVRLRAVAAGIALAPSPLLNCRTAEALVRWTGRVVAPAAALHLQARPNRLLLGSDYVCRNRASEPGKVSEHALGNAVDVLAVGFASREAITVTERRHRDEAESRFQREIREGACAYFTTVLGPGTDADHGDHLHLDQRQRKRGYRICQ